MKSQSVNKRPDQVDYLILQFTQFPTKEEQENLGKEGVTILNYLQSNAFYVTISPKFYNISRSASRNIRSLIPILPEYKIDANLLNKEVPDFAQGGRDKIKIVISYFKGTDILLVKRELAAVVKGSVPTIDENFRLIQTEATKEEILDLARLTWTQSIEMVSPPAEFNNKEGVNLHRSNILNSQIRGLGYGLTGKGVTLGLWDADVENHRDLVSRLKVREYEMHTTDHGTHTCGTIGSAGLLDPRARGMAPEVKIVSWNFNTQSNGLANFQEREKSINEDGIELTSNSFGMRVTSCPNPYSYNYTDASEDLLAYNYPTFLFIYSAGNDQTVCPKGFFTTSKNLKNSLIVAAVDRENQMSSFSSFGPSKDGRLIPNISGDGVDVYSTFFNNSYGYMDGTSMATPGVAGTMALLYQRYKETNGGQKPTSALLRGIACNTATDMGNPGPDYKYGYGVINGLRAVQVLENKTYFNSTVEQGKSISKEIAVPAGAAALKVMLSWTDNYGTVGSSRVLTNNIDLKVTGGGVTYLPWILDPANPNNPAVRGKDNLNNFEQVTISNPQAGSYTITVDGSEIPDGAQNFAIVYDVVMPYITLTYPVGGESLVPAAKEIIHWNSEGYTGKYMLEYSEDGGTTYKTIATDIPANQRSYEWEVPGTLNTANAKIRVSCGTNFSESKAPFSIMTTPVNLRLDELSCGGNSTTLTWDNIANAKYEILKLKGETYEHLAEVTTNSYNIANLSPSNDNYYAVRAIDLTTGSISERSLAVQVNPASKVNELPIKEDFESQTAPNFTLISNNGLSSVKFVNTSQQYGIRLEGPSAPIATAWNTTAATPEECFTKNAAYITKAMICNLNASSLSGKQMFLKFDFRQKFRAAAGTSYFRVKVNGAPVTSIDGTQIYGTTSTVSYKTAYYDLTSFAGNNALTIEIEAVCKTGYTTYVNSSGNYDFSNDTYDKGDFVAIDNLELYEPPKDVAITDLSVSNGNTNSESVTIKVKNLSGTSISSIPVSYQIGTTTANENIAGPLNSFAETTYTFNQKVDLSTDGIYEVKAKVSLDGDQVANNDTKTATVYVDLSNKMTSGTATITGCGITLSDAGGKFLDYPISTTSIRTIKPNTANKNVKITFSEFALESGYDYLYIYDGPTTASPLLGRFDGSTLPPSFTSSATNGELTLKFTSDNSTNDKGFIATLDCVDKQATELALSSINQPSPTTGIKGASESIIATVKNNGIQAVSSYDMFYQINNGTPVKETVNTSIAPATNAAYTFTAKADLSTPGTYKLKVWVKATGDVVTQNDTLSVTITSLPSTSDAGITTIGAIVPTRTSTSPISANLQNFGTLPISNFNVAYSINGGTEVSQLVSGPIAPGATTLVTFATKADLSADMTYNINVYTKLNGDANPNNDGQSVQVVKSPKAPTNVVGSFVTGNTIATSTHRNQFSLTKNYTLEFWLNPNQNPKYGTIFSKGFSIIHHSEYYPAAYNTNCLLLSIAGNLFMTPSNSITNGVWQHVAITSASDGTIKAYINGVEQPLTSSSKAIQSDNLTVPVRIGSNSTYTQPYYGKIDEVRIWNSALDQATIAANLTTDYATNTGGLYAYYKFIEGNNAYVYDYSANDNTAVVLNADVNGTGDGKFWDTPGALLQKVNLIGEKIPAEFDVTSSTIKGIMGENATLNAVVAQFTTSQQSVVKVGNNIQVSGVTPNDFSSNPTIDYTVSGVGFNTGINQTYHLNVTKDLSSDCSMDTYMFDAAVNNLTATIELLKNGTKFSKKVSNFNAEALKASYSISPKAKLILNDAEQANPQSTPTNYSHPLMAQVVSENGRYRNNYLIDLDTRSNEAELISFSIPTYQVGSTAIDKSNHTANVWVKLNTNKSQLTPTFTISPKAGLFAGPIQQQSGTTTNNFISPVKYTVLSEDESTAIDWTVAVQVDDVKPIITLKGESNITIPAESTYTDQGATATDNAEGDISQRITVNSNVNTQVLGVYTVTYNVTDGAGNSAVPVTRTITVVKATPVINITNTDQVFDGTPKSVTVSTTPANLNVLVTYNGSAQQPVGTGSYEVVATVNEVNYQGSAKATLKIKLGSSVDPEEANSAYIYSNGGTIYVNIKEIKSSSSIKIFNRSGVCVYDSGTMSVGMNQIKKNFISGLYIINLTVDGITYKKKVVVVN